MMGIEPFTVRYTLFQKAVIPTGTILFAVMGIVLVAGIPRLYTESIILAAFFAILGVWFLYLAYLGFKLTRDLFLEVSADDEGLTVSRRGGQSRYSWEEVASQRYDLVHRVLRVFDSSGRELFAIDGDAPGCLELRTVLGQVKMDHGANNA